MLKVVQDAAVSSDTAVAGASLLDQLVRDGARQMLAAALQAEVAAYVEAHAEQVDGDGRRLVVRNGSHAEREVTTAAGAVRVRAPRVNDKRVDEVTGERCRFSSAILPVWARKSPKITEVLPLLYLHGLSSSDFTPALEQFLGSGAGLSASVITRLTAQWQDEQRAFNTRSLTDCDYVYMWVDGISPVGPARAGQGLPAGNDRGPRRRHEGADRAGRRAAGVHRVVGRSAALMQAPRDARAGPNGR